MKGFSNRFKIPTILGLAVIISGIAAGVFLTVREQGFISKASPTILPQNITVANISESEVNLSWQTPQPVTSFITFGLRDPNEQVSLDDRDSKSPKAYSMHYVTIKNLLPQTTYQYKIFSGKISTNVSKFTTAAPLTTKVGFRPIVGSVLDGNKPLDEGIVYLSIADATTQAALIKTSGNFLIPISQIRKTDLSEGFPITEDTLAKLTIISEKGQSSASFRLKNLEERLPPIRLGENLDLASIVTSEEDLNRYDLNNDGKINAADNAIILDNFGARSTKAKDKRADLNRDGLVDQKDLDLMAKQINQ